MFFKVALSDLMQFLATGGPLKMMKNTFSFQLKISVLFHDIYIFVFDFLFVQKNGLLRKIKLISKFMTFQPGKKQLLSISESEANQTMKFGKLRTVHMR